MTHPNLPSGLYDLTRGLDRTRAAVHTQAMANERTTESVTRKLLEGLGYYDEDNTLTITEQQSQIDAVKKALASASKKGGGGKGAPEFIISDNAQPSFILIIECKAETKDHASSSVGMGLLEMSPDKDQDYHKKVVRFAADGVLHYAKFLSKNFSVIALAISGQNRSELKISTFLHTQNAACAKWLHTKGGEIIDDLIPWQDYIEHATFDPAVQAIRLSELMTFSRELHDFMRDDVKASESEKPLFVSGYPDRFTKRSLFRQL